jgi:uncharacterized protein YqeY
MADELRVRLRDALRVAMKERNKSAVAAFRTALGVIDNAEAADVSQAPAAEAGHIAGGVAGLGAGEVPREHRTDDELVALLRTEIARWVATAAEYERVNRDTEAADLRAQITALTAVLGPQDENRGNAGIHLT